jgi:hypothetical protein
MNRIGHRDSLRMLVIVALAIMLVIVVLAIIWQALGPL